MDYKIIPDKKITSTANHTVKYLLKLSKKSGFRKKEGLFIIEGRRELKMAIAGDYELQTVYLRSDLNDTLWFKDMIKILPKRPEIVEVSPKIYSKLAVRQTVEGVVAIAREKEFSLRDLEPLNNRLLLVLDAPQKPGNIGAVLRTAAAAGTNGVIITNAEADLYNPNCIRNSLGALFKLKIVFATISEVVKFTLKHGIPLYCSSAKATISYDKVSYKQGAAIVAGSEAKGLGAQWIESATENILIPMDKGPDSLNLAVSVAILIFEARRQMGLNNS